MIRISITPAAFAAIADTLPRGSVAVEPEADANGERRVWVDLSVANKLSAIRGPGESLSDVILRIAALEALGPAKVDPLDEPVRIVGESEPRTPAAAKRRPAPAGQVRRACRPWTR